MCHTATGENYDRPLHVDDVPIIAHQYRHCLGSEAIDRIYDAITDHHTPQPAVLIAVLDMAHRAKHKDRGMYPWPMMPFSALDLESGERVQTDAMVAFHTVFESMALAERNTQLLNTVLKNELGLQMRFVCDCGCITDGADEDVLGSDAYMRVNSVRALAEAIGTPVVRVSSFDDTAWKRRDLDMGPTEIASYERMWSILKSLPVRQNDMAALRGGMDYVRSLKPQGGNMIAA